jgi:hypothetical protein
MLSIIVCSGSADAWRVVGTSIDMESFESRLIYAG